jgi:hypothetical protein
VEEESSQGRPPDFAGDLPAFAVVEQSMPVFPFLQDISPAFPGTGMGRFEGQRGVGTDERLIQPIQMDQGIGATSECWDILGSGLQDPFDDRETFVVEIGVVEAPGEVETRSVEVLVQRKICNPVLEDR